MVAALVVMATLAQAPEVEAVKAWRGPDGQVVEVLTLKPRAAKRALVRVRGADSEHDGLVLPCEVRADAQGADYLTRHAGADWSVLRQRDGVNTVFLPGRPDFRVTFDQAATDQLKPAELLAAHDAQQREGRFPLFARKPWPHLEKKYQAQADAAVRGLTKACGRAVAFRFDWSTFGDEAMAELDAWKVCAPLVSRLESSCAVAKQATTVRCRLGGTFALAQEGDALVFTTTAAGRDGARAFLSTQK